MLISDSYSYVVLIALGVFFLMVGFWAGKDYPLVRQGRKLLKESPHEYLDWEAENGASVHQFWFLLRSSGLFLVTLVMISTLVWAFHNRFWADTVEQSNLESQETLILPGQHWLRFEQPVRLALQGELCSSTSPPRCWPVTLREFWLHPGDTYFAESGYDQQLKLTSYQSSQAQLGQPWFVGHFSLTSIENFLRGIYTLVVGLLMVAIGGNSLFYVNRLWRHHVTHIQSL